MTCPRKDAELLARRASGRLCPEEEVALERHLLECAECRSAAEAQQAVWELLDEWTAPPVSEDFDERVYARIAAESAEPLWKRIWRTAIAGVSWKAAVPAAVACAMMLVVLLLQGPLMDRGFAPAGAAPVALQKQVDIDQVESALDDVDMLSRLGGAAPARTEAGS